MVKPRSGRTLGNASGGSSVGAVSYDVNAIKNAFLARTSGRKLDRRYKDGDGGYFTGGRCGWGVGHIFEEDLQKLVGAFNKVNEMSGAIQALKDCSSSSEFLAHKNSLMARCNQAIAEMDLNTIESEVGYSNGLCIIWQEHTGSFLGPRLIAFKRDLEAQMQEINGLNYEALVELEKLQLEEQQIKKEIEDNYRQAEEAERQGDTVKVAEIYQVIKNLKTKHDGIVNQIMTNPWNKTSNYDYSQGINQIIAILEGKSNPQTPLPNNRTPNPNFPNQPSGSSGRSGGNLPSNSPLNNPWQSQSKKNSNQPDQQTLIFIVLAAGVIIFLMMNQKDSPSKSQANYEDYDY